jgi:hypothetical protein
MSSNQRAAEELWNKQSDEAIVFGRTYLHALWRLAGEQNLIHLLHTNPVEFDRLNKLFNETQWRESPKEVAKVISGESPVSKEIPKSLLDWLNSDKVSDDDRKRFFYYLAYRAACLENLSFY